MTRVYLTAQSGGAKLQELKTKLLSLIVDEEGITSEALAQKAGAEQELVDAILAELSNEGKVRLYL